MAHREVRPTITEAQLLDLARRYLSGARTVAPVPEGGADHLVYFADEALVLKLPRPDGNLAWPAREALILQTLANTPGLPMPRLFGCDVNEAANPPHICMSRIPGVSLDKLPGLAAELRAAALREVGRAMAIMHQQPIERFQASGLFTGVRSDLLPFGEYETWRALEPYLRRRWEWGMNAIESDEVVSPASQQKLQTVFEEGLAALPEHFEPVLLHNDIRPVHLFVNPETGRLTGIIDYADATIGPAEIDFFYLWRRWWDFREDVEAVVKGYGREMAVPNEFQTTITFMHLIAAVGTCGQTTPDFRQLAHAEVRAYLES